MRDERRAAGVTATLWMLVAGLIGMYLLLFAMCAAGRLARPADEFTYGESWLLDGARQVAQGAGLYAPANQVPLMHVAYTPLYYAVVGGLQRAFGDGGYTVGRWVSLIGTLVGASALAWSMQRLTARWSVGLLAVGLFLTQNLTTLLWAPLHRVDPLALGLTLVGLALATAGRFSLAGVFFLLALMTKQTYVVAPLAVAGALWPCKARLLRFAAIVVGGSVVGVGLAQWLTRGWFLWHTVVANGNEPDLPTFSALMGSFMQFNGLPVLAALVSFVLPARPPVRPHGRTYPTGSPGNAAPQARQQDTRQAAFPGERLWRLYLVGTLLTLPTIAKLGASSNYWLELTAASAAALALASHRLAVWPLARPLAPTIVAGALLVAVPGYQATAVEAAANLSDLIQPTQPRYLSLVADIGAAPYRVEAHFIDKIAHEPGDLLTDNSGLAVAAGKRVEYEFQIFQLLHVEGLWSEQPILDAINARRFSLVALMHPLDGPALGTRWTPAVHKALNSAYTPAGVEAGFWLYRPRGY